MECFNVLVARKNWVESRRMGAWSSRRPRVNVIGPHWRRRTRRSRAPVPPSRGIVRVTAGCEIQALGHLTFAMRASSMVLLMAGTTTSPFPGRADTLVRPPRAVTLAATGASPAAPASPLPPDATEAHDRTPAAMRLNPPLMAGPAVCRQSPEAGAGRFGDRVWLCARGHRAAVTLRSGEPSLPA